MEPTSSKRSTSIVILLATILLIGGAVFFSQANDPKENADKTSVRQTNEAAKKQAAITDNKPGDKIASAYKEGSYDASGNYQSPGGNQQIKISIKLDSDGTIKDTSAVGDDKSTDSKFYQSSFITNYKEKVVGKNINEVKLDRVGNSSLTSEGFNKALEDIKNQAKA